MARVSEQPGTAREQQPIRTQPLPAVPAVYEPAAPREQSSERVGYPAAARPWWTVPLPEPDAAAPAAPAGGVRGPAPAGARRTLRSAAMARGRRRAWRILLPFAAAPLLAAGAVAALLPDPATSTPQAVAPARTTPAAASRGTRSAPAASPSSAAPGAPADLAPLSSGPASGFLSQAGVAVDGEIENAWTWTDTAGRHLLATMRAAGGDGGGGSPASVTLRVALLDGLDSTPTAVRRLRDPALHCSQGQALSADFTTAAFAVRDLDADGVDEVMVGWTAACAGSTNGTRVRLTLMSGNQLFVVRGQAGGDVPATEPGAAGAGSGSGTLTLSPGSGSWPQPFLDSALAIFHQLYF